jgi:transcription antitermination protein NusB
VPSRRKTREFVLQVLFAADARNQDPGDALEYLESHFQHEQDEDLKMHRVVKEFAQALVVAVSENLEAIDKLIAHLSHNWKLSRINRVDRNILRMAIAEFTVFHEVPGKVILNEAIEIGKKYGAENSAAFINGILDRIHVLEKRPSSASQLQELLDALD